MILDINRKNLTFKIAVFNNNFIEDMLRKEEVFNLIDKCKVFKYISDSRIDGNPIFQLNESIRRNMKINKILNGHDVNLKDILNTFEKIKEHEIEYINVS